MQAFNDGTVTSVFMEASVESSMEDMEDMKACTEVLSAIEAFTKVSSTEDFIEASVEASMEE